MVSCLTVPGWLRQASGVGVKVGGMGLGVNVIVAVGGGGKVTVWVGIISFGVEQAESPKRSVRVAIQIVVCRVSILYALYSAGSFHRGVDPDGISKLDFLGGIS